jgi:hypothetical protein
MQSLYFDATAARLGRSFETAPRGVTILPASAAAKAGACVILTVIFFSARA